jgi:segregation and condensation protein A
MADGPTADDAAETPAARPSRSRRTRAPSGRRGCTANRCSPCRTDLYIPPDALEVFLEAFEGPLDLLLYLIRKQNFNILDIPMAERHAPVPELRRGDPQAATSSWPPNTC